MTSFLIRGGSLGIVLAAAGAAGRVEPFGWRLLALFGACALTQVLFIGRFPRSLAWKEAYNGAIKRGKVTNVALTYEDDK